MEREEKRYRAWIRCKSLYEKRMNILIQLGKANLEYYQAKSEYESLDRELMMEKRTILKSTGLRVGQTRTVKTRDLTLEEIKSVADKLGIDLSKLKVGG